MALRRRPVYVPTDTYAHIDLDLAGLLNFSGPCTTHAWACLNTRLGRTVHRLQCPGMCDACAALSTAHSDRCGYSACVRRAPSLFFLRICFSLAACFRCTAVPCCTLKGRAMQCSTVAGCVYIYIYSFQKALASALEATLPWKFYFGQQ